MPMTKTKHREPPPTCAYATAEDFAFTCTQPGTVLSEFGALMCKLHARRVLKEIRSKDPGYVSLSTLARRRNAAQRRQIEGGTRV